MVIGMSIAIGYTSHTFVIAHILGQETVAEYSVPYRLFSIVTVVLSFFLIPLWPAYAEAAARGDVAWVRRTLRRSVQWGLAFNVTAGIVLILLGRQIIHLWVGSQVTPSNAADDRVRTVLVGELFARADLDVAERAERRALSACLLGINGDLEPCAIDLFD